MRDVEGDCYGKFNGFEICTDEEVMGSELVEASFFGITGGVEVKPSNGLVSHGASADMMIDLVSLSVCLFGVPKCNV